jgi:hypothetical protein
MNAQLATLLPLPAALQSSPRARPHRPGRRAPAGEVTIRAKALARFNRLLVGLQHDPLDREQLAGACRELMDRSSGERCAAGIAQRQQLAEAVERMIRDATWQQARRAEAGLIAHVRRVGRSSYVPAATTRAFRVC